MRRATTATVLLTVLAVTTPARAAAIPAYGVITITNDGFGAVPTTTYDPATWTCSTEFFGQFNAPTAITVTCDPIDQSATFVCPLMVVTTHTKGAAARAGGRASCTRSLDTGIVSGINTAQRRGDLGPVVVVTCTAYGDTVPLIPPYTVTCSEPGLPTLTP